MAFDWNRVLFTCAICRRDILARHSHAGRQHQLEPVCRICDRDYGGPEPQHGAFRDRRRAVQVSALAEALRCLAANKIYGGANGRA